jgi:hypothetical protein
MSKRLFISVDFDGTIVTEGFPNIGELKPRTVELLHLLREKGHNIIIWTSRSGKFEEDAKQFLIKNNIPFDYINENPEDEFFKRGEQGRKLFSHYYLDDRAIHVDDIEKLINIIKGNDTMVGKKAILKASFTLAEYCGCNLNESECGYPDDIVQFEQGSVVEILKEVKSNNDFRQFIVYSEELGEATVVAETMLEIS